jgi:2,4-dienoyl-CoA reductase-like NADH-dependent reductase (Old Yellow Enzyme family)/thioredoxin reductase
MVVKEMESLFRPIKIGDMELKNRIVMAPMGTCFATVDGYVSDQMVDYYIERARGGAGLITVEATCVDAPLGKAGPWLPMISDDKYIPGLKRLAEAVQAEGAKISLQLMHAGRYAFSFVIGTQPVAPSPIASRYTKETPRELTTEEVEAIIEKFGDAARRALEAGFNAVELMGCSGYLISQFTSPLTNKRADRFGGDTAARASFAVEIIRNIREKVGRDFPISFKHSVDEYMPGGTTIEDSKIIVKRAEEAGASIIHAWAGWHESPTPMLPMSVKRGAFVHLAEAMKEAVNIPVIAVGRINDPRLADQVIREGKADLVAFGRAFLADPYFPKKAEEGRFDDIRMCIGCCRCFDTLMRGRPPVVCSLNAELGREGKKRIKSTNMTKKVLIIGGGPGGMEAARVAALRGHEVTLWEEKSRLGGNMVLASVAPYKEEISNITNYLTHQVGKLGVKVELNKEATLEAVIEANADEVILACGASPIIPEIPGVKGGNVVTAIDVLAGKAKAGGRVVVIGGGMIGCEVAEFLLDKVEKVILVEMLEKIAQDIGPTTQWVVRRRIKDSEIGVLTSAKVTSIQDKGVTVEKEGKTQTIAADTIVLAVGLKSNKELTEALRGKVPRLHPIGDCTKVNKILEAIHAGFEVGCEI